MEKATLEMKFGGKFEEDAPERDGKDPSLLFTLQIRHGDQRQSTRDGRVQEGPATGPAPRWELRILKRAPRT